MSRYPRSPPELARSPSLGWPSLRAGILRTTDERSQGRRLGRFRVARAFDLRARRASCAVGGLRCSSIPHFPLLLRRTFPLRSARLRMSYRTAPHHVMPRHATPRHTRPGRARRVAPISLYNSERNRVGPERGASRREGMYRNPITLYRVGRLLRALWRFSSCLLLEQRERHVRIRWWSTNSILFYSFNSFLKIRRKTYKRYIFNRVSKDFLKVSVELVRISASTNDFFVAWICICIVYTYNVQV